MFQRNFANPSGDDVADKARPLKTATNHIKNGSLSLTGWALIKARYGRLRKVCYSPERVKSFFVKGECEF